MRSDLSPRVDWDQIPLYVARAHALRSAEMGRLLRRVGARVAGLVRRLRTPASERWTRPTGPAPSSP